MGARRVACAVLVGSNALYILLVALGNITDFATNRGFVQHVMAMDTTNFGAPGAAADPNIAWRAVTTPWVHDVVYVCIICWEIAAGAVLAAALGAWIFERQARYAKARALSTIGLLMVLLLFVGGFVDVGGEWFQMWRSTRWNGLDAALRNIVIAGLTLLLVQLPIPDSEVPGHSSPVRGCSAGRGRQSGGVDEG